jgi:phosphoglycerol transferase MdoB-like AlkP superfamily enzyme
MTSFYLWPIITLIGLLIYKRSLIGYSQLYLDAVTDLLFVVVMFILAIQRRSTIARWLAGIAATFIIFYYWLDISAFVAIKTPLTWNSFVANYQNIDVVPYFISTKLIIFTVLIVLVIGLLNKRTVSYKTPATTTNFYCFLSLAGLILAFFVIHNSAPSQTNATIDLSSHTLFSTQFVAEEATKIYQDHVGLVKRIEDFLSGTQWQNPLAKENDKRNIIMVLSESLSGVDSKYAGGLFNRLPMIDKMQSEGLAFKNLTSNGRITVHGLASLLLGLQTTKIFVSHVEQQFPADKFYEKNLIQYAKKAGYHTIVISPGQPRSWFTNWFQQVGFDEIYDRESPEFRSVPRFTWKAPSDEAMYQLAEKITSQKKGPYLILIETVSLHQSYVLPDAKYKVDDNELHNLINYVDQTTYQFYAKLKAANYFNNGVLLLLGDHRRFEPMEPEESKNGGEAIWDERIVGCLVGKSVAQHFISPLPFSTLDLNTLMHFVIQDAIVDESTLVKSNIANQLGIEVPFNVTLLDDNHGTYLIRSLKYAPFYISILGNIPFEKIPNEAYKQATVYLMKNYQWTQKKLVGK